MRGFFKFKLDLALLLLLFSATLYSQYKVHPAVSVIDAYYDVVPKDNPLFSSPMRTIPYLKDNKKENELRDALDGLMSYRHDLALRLSQCEGPLKVCDEKLLLEAKAFSNWYTDEKKIFIKNLSLTVNSQGFSERYDYDLSFDQKYLNKSKLDMLSLQSKSNKKSQENISQDFQDFVAALTIYDRVDMAYKCLSDPEPKKYNSEARYACLLDIEFAFANNLLKKDFEKTLIKLLEVKLMVGDIGSAWAGIALGLLAQYYPPKSYDPSAISVVSIAYEDYGGREKGIREQIYSKLISRITDYKVPLLSRQGMAEGLGFFGSSVVPDIDKIIKELNGYVYKDERIRNDQINELISQALQYGTFGLYKPGYSFDEESTSAITAFYLFKVLAHIAKTENHYLAKKIILEQMRYSCINDDYACTDQHSFTMGVWASIAAGYYGMPESHAYLADIARWHEEFKKGVKAVPIKISELAYSIIPKYIRDVNKIAKPEAGNWENVAGFTYDVLRQTRDALVFIFAFEAAGASIIAGLYGTEAAIGSSFLAADAGYIIAARYGTTGAYEMTLMMAQRSYAEAFASTTAGKVTNRIFKGLNELALKFGGKVDKLKSLLRINRSTFKSTPTSSTLAKNQAKVVYDTPATKIELSGKDAVGDLVNQAKSNPEFVPLKTNKPIKADVSGSGFTQGELMGTTKNWDDIMGINKDWGSIMGRTADDVFTPSSSGFSSVTKPKTLPTLTGSGTGLKLSPTNLAPSTTGVNVNTASGVWNMPTAVASTPQVFSDISQLATMSKVTAIASIPQIGDFLISPSTKTVQEWKHPEQLIEEHKAKELFVITITKEDGSQLHYYLWANKGEEGLSELDALVRQLQSMGKVSINGNDYDSFKRAVAQKDEAVPQYGAVASNENDASSENALNEEAVNTNLPSEEVSDLTGRESFPIEQYYPNINPDKISKASRAFILWRSKTPRYIPDSDFALHYYTKAQKEAYFDSIRDKVYGKMEKEVLSKEEYVARMAKIDEEQTLPEKTPLDESKRSRIELVNPAGLKIQDYIGSEGIELFTVPETSSVPGSGIEERPLFNLSKYYEETIFKHPYFADAPNRLDTYLMNQGAKSKELLKYNYKFFIDSDGLIYVTGSRSDHDLIRRAYFKDKELITWGNIYMSKSAMSTKSEESYIIKVDPYANKGKFKTEKYFFDYINKLYELENRKNPFTETYGGLVYKETIEPSSMMNVSDYYPEGEIEVYTVDASSVPQGRGDLDFSYGRALKVLEREKNKKGESYSTHNVNKLDPIIIEEGIKKYEFASSVGGFKYFIDAKGNFYVSNRYDYHAKIIMSGELKDKLLLDQGYLNLRRHKLPDGRVAYTFDISSSAKDKNNLDRKRFLVDYIKKMYELEGLSDPFINLDGVDYLIIKD